MEPEPFKTPNQAPTPLAAEEATSAIAVHASYGRYVYKYIAYRQYGFESADRTAARLDKSSFQIQGPNDHAAHCIARRPRVILSEIIDLEGRKA